MVTVQIHKTGKERCSLSGTETDGVFVAFEGEAALFLSWRSFRQLVQFRLAQKSTATGTPPPAFTPTTVTGAK